MCYNHIVMENELEQTPAPRRKMYVVKESIRGVYMWKVPGKGYISDGDGHFLMIEAIEGSESRIKALRDMVKSDFGIEEGYPVFFSGNRIVDDEEYERQKERHRRGQTPDIWDVNSIESERAHAHDIARRR
jgi:hypothetical protein